MTHCITSLTSNITLKLAFNNCVTKVYKKKDTVLLQFCEHQLYLANVNINYPLSAKVRKYD